MRFYRGVYALLLFLLLPLAALADVELLRWQIDGYPFEFVIPNVVGQAPALARDRYLRALSKEVILQYRQQLPAQMSDTKLTPWNLSDPAPVIVAIANDIDDLSAVPTRMIRVTDPLKHGAKVMLLPLAAAQAVPASERAGFYKLLGTQVDLLISVGGDDIDPQLYRQANQHAVNILPSRDKEELAIVSNYLKKGKGLFVGICRGHQMGVVATGCPLVQDIATQLGEEHPLGVAHTIELKPDAASTFGRKIFGPNAVIEVASNHHQAGDLSVNNPNIIELAVSQDQKPITEMVDFYQGRGLGVQFHPEDMPGTLVNFRFYDLLKTEAQAAATRRTLPPIIRFDAAKTLFGIEYSFQDKTMVAEPGRMTMETPHKRERFEALQSAYLEELYLDTNSLVTKPGSFKPGTFIDVPGDGQYVMNMEPVTIEVNTTPKIFSQILPTAQKLFRATETAALVPYVQPGAERSGMGHIHVGAKTIGDSPFYKHPHLLRNLMVYLHKHPSLLWGFAEAYDVGLASNIESYHHGERQIDFQNAVKKFDQWYLAAQKNGGSTADGLRQFLLFLSEEGYAHNTDFFHHYRYINLEHLKRLMVGPIDPALEGKYTVEFRNFRPPASPQHAQANAELLMALIEKQSAPGFLEPFTFISDNEFANFFTAGKTASDWQIVKRELPWANQIWNQSIDEFVQIQNATKVFSLGLGRKISIYPAFSEKEMKGKYFEVRVLLTDDQLPVIKLKDLTIALERMTIDGNSYGVGLVRAADFTQQGLDITLLRSRPSCQTAFSWLSP